MPLFELITENTVKIPLKSRKKSDVIKELVKILKSSGKIKDPKTVLADVLKREDLASTGLGEGIAVPHAKTTAVDTLTIALGLSPRGIDFDSLDDQPAHIFFLLLAPPDQSGPHLQALTEIAKMNRNKKFCREILDASTSAEVASLFARESL
jgi:nitrogen PTS system EIIA component